MQTLEEQFNTRLNAFLGSTGLRPTTLGMQAVGDPSLLRQIERGRSPSLRTADRVLAFVADCDLDSGGPRTPPRGHRRRKPSSRARRTRRGRAMTGARLTAALECANDAGGRCALWPSGDAHACYGVSHDTATSCGLRGRVGQRRTSSTDRDGSDPPVQGPGTGSGAGVFAHLPPPSWGPSRAIDPSRKGVGPMRPATLAIIGTALGAAAIYAVARAAGLTDLGLRVDLAEGDWE